MMSVSIGGEVAMSSRIWSAMVDDESLFFAQSRRQEEGQTAPARYEVYPSYVHTMTTSYYDL